VPVLAERDRRHRRHVARVDHRDPRLAGRGEQPTGRAHRVGQGQQVRHVEARVQDDGCDAGRAQVALDLRVPARVEQRRVGRRARSPRTNARTGTPRSRSSRTTCEPTLPWRRSRGRLSSPAS
jgi:hypothetical protein